MVIVDSSVHCSFVSFYCSRPSVPSPRPRFLVPWALRGAMPALHITPWSTWAEWTYLHDLARRGPPAAATPALATYRARHPAALPLAIESTFALQSLLGAPPSYAARLALALALVRLVNGLTDRLQPRAATAAARPVATLAAAAGLPAGWVALRHDAVHADKL